MVKVPSEKDHKQSASVVASFEAKTLNEIDSLTLEQKGWPIGEELFLSLSQIYTLYGWNPLDNYGQAAEVYLAQCLINDDGSFDTTVYVFTVDPDYEIHTSNGTFSDEVRNETFTKEDTILLSFDNVYKFPYLIDQLISAEWEGDVFNEYGEIIEYPTITLENNCLVSSEIVYGSIRYTVEVTAYAHDLNVTVIPDTEENIYATNVIAFQNKKATTLSITEPPTNDACKALAVDIHTVSDDDDDPGDDPPIASHVPVTFAFFDYCTGEVIEPSYIIIDGTITVSDFVTPVELTVGEHSVKIFANNYINSDEDDLANDSFTVPLIVTGIV